MYLRNTDGSPAVRLGEGISCALSPDGSLALSIPRRAATHFTLLPTGAGQPRTLADHGLTYVGAAAWLPDGRHFVSLGYQPGHRPRAYLEDLDGSPPRPITPEGVASFPALSPDGSSRCP